MLNKVFLLAIGLVVGAVLSMYVTHFGERRSLTPIIISTPVPSATPAPTPTALPILVYVNGAVLVPDVYELPPGSRIIHAVEAAGGFTEEANTAAMNLAQPLTDGVYLYVPQTTEDSEVPEEIISTPDVPSRSETVNLQGGVLIDINSAGATELEMLPGIGPALAQRIIDHRTANGTFAAIEALMDVSGIGDAKFSQVRDLITTGE